MGSYNRNLAGIILAIWLCIGLKLYTTAIVTDNLRGFGYSMLHLIIVGVGTFFALREKPFSN